MASYDLIANGMLISSTYARRFSTQPSVLPYLFPLSLRVPTRARQSSILSALPLKKLRQKGQKVWMIRIPFVLLFVFLVELKGGAGRCLNGDSRSGPDMCHNVDKGFLLLLCIFVACRVWGLFCFHFLKRSRSLTPSSAHLLVPIPSLSPFGLVRRCGERRMAKTSTGRE